MKDWIRAQGGVGEFDEKGPSHFGDFAGEREALASGAGLWWRAGWHLHALEGEKRVGFLHDYITQEVRREVGEGAYGCLLTVKGGLVADVWTFLRKDDLLLLSAPAAGPSAVKHLKRYALLARVGIKAREFTVLSVVGPSAAGAVSKALGESPESDLDHVEVSWEGSSVCLARNDWLGVPGYDVFVPNEAAEGAAEALEAAGAAPVGEDAIRDLRVRRGIPVYGVDMHEKTLPLEAGLEERAIDYDKGCYTGQEVVVRIKHRGKINRHLRGIRLDSAPAAELPVPLFNETGKEVSAVTSLTPEGEGALGLAVVHRKYPPGTKLRLGSVEGAEVEVLELGA